MILLLILLITLEVVICPVEIMCSYYLPGYYLPPLAKFEKTGPVLIPSIEN